MVDEDTSLKLGLSLFVGNSLDKVFHQAVDGSPSCGGCFFPLLGVCLNNH